MGLKIIGAGYGRTGTASTKQALEVLGYPCYHMFEIIDNKENKSHLDFWNNVANSPAGTQHDWDKVFSKYSAALDNPACCVYKELLENNPEAKVLLTVHPKGAQSWYESTIETIYSEHRWEFKFLQFFIPFAKKFGNMSGKLIWQRSHQNTMIDREAAINRYNQHIEEVKSHVPKNQLLIFSVDQGWEPLCNFLGKEVPDIPFPNVNDRSEIKKTIRKMKMGAYFFILIALLMVAAVSWGVLSLFF